MGRAVKSATAPSHGWRAEATAVRAYPAMVSFIVPAYNEAAHIDGVVKSIHESAAAARIVYEVVVVNDDSSDDTANLAEAAGARVVHVTKRQIAAVRNAGAREAKGDAFIFVDGDTLATPGSVQGALRALRSGAVGGGSFVRFDRVPWIINATMRVLLESFYALRLAAGCFVFCRRDAFEAVGGFDERYFASEEIWFSQAINRRGRFVVVREPVITSARKLHRYGLGGLLVKSIQIGMRGETGVQRREGLELWYDGMRGQSST